MKGLNYILKIIIMFFKTCYFKFEYERHFSELPYKIG